MEVENNHSLVVSNTSQVIDYPKLRKARFIKVKVNIKEKPYVNALINTFTFLPIPLVFGKILSKFLVSKIKEETDLAFSKEDIIRIINASKGLKVDVETKDVFVKIKIM